MLSYEEVKELARQKGYSLRELADKTGYEFSGFYKALNRNSLKYEARVVLAETLGISMEELQGEITLGENTVRYSSQSLRKSYSLESGEPSSEPQQIFFNKNLNLSELRQDPITSEYRYLIDSLKEQLHTKNELLRIQQKMIGELQEKIDRMEREKDK